MIFHWPQLTMLALLFLGLGISMAKHGEPRSLESIWSTLVSVIINLTLLYYGGFFSPHS